MAKRGRRSAYTQALGEEICRRLGEGETLTGICRDEHIPTRATVLRWLLNKDETFDDFRYGYAQARELQADCYVDECIDIADDARNDWMDKETAKGTIRVLDHEHVQRSRLRIDTRKWCAATRYPAKYGGLLPKDGDKPPEEKPQTIVLEILPKPDGKAG